MSQLDIAKTDTSDLTNVVTAFSVDTAETDGPGDQKETKWDNTDWAQYLGYYKAIPELAMAIDTKATWTIGKGFEADPDTTFILDSLKGWGKDTFNTIMENMIRTYYIGGDAYCEIIRDKKGNLINLKPLDPGIITIVVNRQGVIKRYEQRSKVKSPTKKLDPDKIFHLARNRVADEIHGVSMITPLENVIKWSNSAMDAQNEIMERYLKPRFFFHLDTDDTAKIAAFKAKNDAAVNTGENIYIPKDAVVPEMISVAPNATLNPLPWIESLRKLFFQAAGVPEIVAGGGGGVLTEASAKISYLAFQQTIEEEQLFIEEQVGMQLGLGIELEFPASLENELLSDNKKDGDEAIQPNETTAGSGQ